MSENKLNLVMVDDDVAIVRILEHIVAQHLSDLFDIVTFTDSRAALDWITEWGCNVLISDLEMPGIGGLDLLQAGKRRQADTHTILLTAHSSWERIAEAIEQGVNDYLLKPVDQAQIVDLLRQKHRSLSRSSAAECEALNGSPVLGCGDLSPL
ncbi:MAG: response regulator [Pirellulales bacterium]